MAHHKRITKVSSRFSLKKILWGEGHVPRHFLFRMRTTKEISFVQFREKGIIVPVSIIGDDHYLLSYDKKLLRYTSQPNKYINIVEKARDESRKPRLQGGATTTSVTTLTGIS
jgi:hypothetical protein